MTNLRDTIKLEQENKRLKERIEKLTEKVEFTDNGWIMRRSPYGGN